MPISRRFVGCPGICGFESTDAISKNRERRTFAPLGRHQEINQAKRERQRNMLLAIKAHISNGTVHKIPADLREALGSDQRALAVWESLTPLARNEWICWTTAVKRPETRKEHVERVRTELKQGMHRPCCWIGCIHRKDKSISPSVQWVLNRRSKSS